MRRRHTQHRGKKRGRGESTANEWGERRDRKRRRRRRTNKRERRSWGNRCCRSETLRPRNESRRRARAEMRREGGRKGGRGRERQLHNINSLGLSALPPATRGPTCTHAICNCRLESNPILSNIESYFTPSGPHVHAAFVQKGQYKFTFRQIESYP